MPKVLILCESQHLHSSNPRMLPYNTGREIPIPRIRGGDPWRYGNGRKPKRLFPAYAGVIRRVYRGRPPSAPIPRIRGGNPLMYAGSSPHESCSPQWQQLTQKPLRRVVTLRRGLISLFTKSQEWTFPLSHHSFHPDLPRQSNSNSGRKPQNPSCPTNQACRDLSIHRLLLHLCI